LVLASGWFGCYGEETIMPDKLVIDIPPSLKLPPDIHDQRLLRGAIAASTTKAACRRAKPRI